MCLSTDDDSFILVGSGRRTVAALGALAAVAEGNRGGVEGGRALERPVRSANCEDGYSRLRIIPPCTPSAGRNSPARRPPRLILAPARTLRAPFGSLSRCSAPFRHLGRRSRGFPLRTSPIPRPQSHTSPRRAKAPPRPGSVMKSQLPCSNIPLLLQPMWRRLHSSSYPNNPGKLFGLFLPPCSGYSDSSGIIFQKSSKFQRKFAATAAAAPRIQVQKRDVT